MILLLVLAACRRGEEDALGDPVDLVLAIDPFIGTGGIGYEVGCATPAASWPFGLVKAGPDTADAGGSDMGFYRGGGYHAEDTFIQGFSQLHLHGTGLAGYGSVALMPVALEGDVPRGVTEDDYRAPFDPDTQVARPGRYDVRLTDPPVTAAMAVTQRSAVHAYDFDATVESPGILVDLGHVLGSGVVPSAAIVLDPSTGEMSGTMVNDGDLGPGIPVWFRARFDPLPTTWGVWSGDDDAGMMILPLTTAASREGKHVRVGGWFGWDAGTQVRVRVALSGTSEGGASVNFDAEHTTFDVDVTEAAARAEWSRWLAPVRVWGGSESDQVMFATALYHALQMPTRWNDADGTYRGFDGKLHTSGEDFASDFSLWDTYRTTHPLYTLLWPEAHAMLLHSLARMAVEGGNVPRWPLGATDTGTMVGMPAHIVWSEALLKDLSGFGETDLADAASSVFLSGGAAAFGEAPEVSWLEDPGYYPADAVGRSVAWTLEAAIADHALADAFDRLGRATEAERFRARSASWQNLYRDETGWFEGRAADGSWSGLDDPDAWDEVYAEGNARQYAWLVPQDPDALFERMGGAEVALARLTELMEETAAAHGDTPGVPPTWYWHGNEPDLHVPWLFALAGDPASTRAWVAWIRANLYGTGPDGLAGNDDAGTLSAWLVFADLGLYPLAGTDRYVLGDPTFDRIELDRVDGTTLTITREGDDGTVRADEAEVGPELSHDTLTTTEALTFSFDER